MSRSAVFTVVDPDARIRTGPPNFQWRFPERIPRYTRILILEESGKYVRVEGLRGKRYGWTARSNLGTYFRDSAELAELKPEKPIGIHGSWSSKKKALARTYNRLGGLLGQVADLTRVETEACLAVWQVESGGRSHTPGRATIRFENHLLFRWWGDQHLTTYDRHYQHGGHNGVPGKSWHNHRFRENPSESFGKVHASQTSEYRALELAKSLSTADMALQCISIGGPQILISNYKLLSYRSPSTMFEAFQESERAHVLGFFDYCRHVLPNEKLIAALRTKEWADFAAGYNGPGNVTKYSGLIQDSYAVASSLFV